MEQDEQLACRQERERSTIWPEFPQKCDGNGFPSHSGAINLTTAVSEGSSKEHSELLDKTGGLKRFWIKIGFVLCLYTPVSPSVPEM